MHIYIYSHAYCTAGAFACKAAGTETVVRAFIRDVPLRVSSVHLASFDRQLSFSDALNGLRDYKLELSM